MSNVEIKTTETVSSKDIEQQKLKNKEQREKALKEYKGKRKPYIEKKLNFLFKKERKTYEIEKNYLGINNWDDIIQLGYKNPELCLIKIKKAEEYTNNKLKQLNKKNIKIDKKQQKNNIILENKEGKKKNQAIELKGNTYDILGIVDMNNEHILKSSEEKLKEFLNTPEGKKLDIIKKTLGIYINYLRSIKDNLEFKGIRALDNDLNKYIKIIEYIVGDINSNMMKMNLNKVKIKKDIEKIFKIGENINDLGFNNIKKQIRKINKFLIGLLDKKGNIDKTKETLIMLKIMRDIDKNDNTGKYNLSDDIRNELIDYVLNNKELNKDPNIKNRFDKIKEDFKNPSEFIKGLIKAYNDKIENWEEVFWKLNIYYTDKSQEYLIKHGIDIKGAIKDIRKYIETNLGKKTEIYVKKELKNLIEKKLNKMGIKYKQEVLDKEINLGYNKYREKVKQKLILYIKQKSLDWILKVFPKNLEKAKKLDEGVNIYTDIEGIGNFDLSDKTYDNLKEVVRELEIQILLMLISGGLGDLAALRFMSIAKWEKIDTLGKIGIIGGIDGTTFHLSYNTLHNIREGKPLTYNLDNSKDWVKDILFITALKGFNTFKINNKDIITINGNGKNILDTVEEITTIKGGKLKFKEKVWNTLKIQGISIGVETIALIGIGSGINIIFGDKIVNNPEEIINIIAMVIGLRISNKGVTYFVDKVNGKVKIFILEKKEKNKFDKLVLKESEDGGKDRPPDTGNSEELHTSGSIPLTELFKEGKGLKGYERVRDKIINKALTKKGAEDLLKDEKFQEIRNKFLDKFLETPAIIFRIERNKWDKDKLKERLIEDFNKMVKTLGNVENLSKKMKGTKEEKKMKAIKELFLIENNKELGEVLASMYNKVYNKKVNIKSGVINKFIK